MKRLFFLPFIFAGLMAQQLNFSPPKLSSPQEEIIIQFSKEAKQSPIKIALVMPKKIIGRYSVASVDTIMGYLSAREVDFEFEVFDSGDESEDSIQSTLDLIQEQRFQFIIAIFTAKGAYETSKLDLKTPVYIPTVNANQIDFSPSDNILLFFGGISYKEQIQELLRLHEVENLLAYNDDSPVGKRLSTTLKTFTPEIQELTITNEIAATFDKQINQQNALIDGVDIFLNTPVVKSGLLLSQLTYSRKKISKILSTQINYNPSITILTQKQDRRNLYIASSIGTTNQKLLEYASLLNSDLKFDWVNYSTALGMEVFFRFIFPDSLPFFDEVIKDNQVQYQTKIYQIDQKDFFIPIDTSRFKPIALPQPEQTTWEEEMDLDQDIIETTPITPEEENKEESTQTP